MALSLPFAAATLDVACYGLQPPSIPNVEVLRITSSAVQNFTYTPVTGLTGEPITGNTGDPAQLAFCNVSIVLTHPGDNDTVFVSVWLPPKGSWNHRYTATGGGGLGAGYDFNMVSPLAAGFATSATDAGLTLNNTVMADTGLWGLKEDGTVNEALFKNLGYRSIHDMAVASKDVIEQFYGVAAKYSYWAGCSQGGRQGYAAASKYPTDFDGILATAPGLGFGHVGIAAFWPVVVMYNEGEYVPSCIFDIYGKALLEFCDPLDGLADGLISDYSLLMSCPRAFNASTLIGRNVACPEAGNVTVTVTVTERHATIVTKILNGPTHHGKQYWFGTVPGATFSGVADTVFDNATGKWLPKPFVPAAGWLRNIIAPQMGIEVVPEDQYQAASIFTLTYDQYFAAFNKSLALAAPYLGDSYLDFRSFQNSGGKLLTWVGLADQFVHPAHLFHFHASVAKTLLPGNSSVINDFYRIFTAPGVGHCAGGVGPQPVNPMGALMEWVEQGKAPDTLMAKGNNTFVREIVRDLCLYPKKSIYNHGELVQYGSFGCQEPQGQTTKNGARDIGENGDKESGAVSLEVLGGWARTWMTFSYLFHLVLGVFIATVLLGAWGEEAESDEDEDDETEDDCDDEDHEDQDEHDEDEESTDDGATVRVG
ncbi:tannase and feruloyl esterase-domain-containing protein [Aspergillus recurvatus]